MKRTLLLLFLVLILLSASLPAEELNTPTVLKMLTSKYKTINNYHCTIESFEKLGKKEHNRILDYNFTRPGYIFIKILKGKNKGSRVLYRDDKIKASMGGILSAIRVLFKPTNKKVLSLRGHGTHESGWEYTLKSINDMIAQGWKPSFSDNSKKETDQWTIELSSTTGNTTCLHKYTIDPEEKLIMQMCYYENEELLSDSTFSCIELNTDLDPKLFK